MCQEKYILLINSSRAQKPVGFPFKLNPYTQISSEEQDREGN